MPYAPELAPFIRRTATNLGISPSDLGTAMSYETGGKMDHNLWGGAGGKYLGLIQFGPEEQAKYGVKPDMPLDDHMKAVEGFLRDRGVKPGMGMLDIYSTINAGSPGRYNASDANNGGMPGTVADKVATQMVGHRARANSILGDASAPPIPINPPDQQRGAAAYGSLDGGLQQGPTVSGTPLDMATPAQAAEQAPGAGAGGVDMTKLLAAVGGMKQPGQQQEEGTPSVPINIPQPPGLPAAARLAQIMQSLSTRS